MRIKNLFSVIIINILIIYYKLKNKKIIFFYHPRKLLTFIHTFYIEDLFKDSNLNFLLIHGHVTDKNLGKNYFFIKEGYLKFILNVDIFISCLICDKFTKGSKSIYLSHDIYDSPLVGFEKEQEMCERFSLYDIIFLPSQILIKFFNKMFSKYNNSPKIKLPILKEIGYPKFDFLEKKIKNIAESSKDSIVIAPTNIYGLQDLTLINHLKELIEGLLHKTEFNVILRPHPSNRDDTKILQIKNLFKSSSKFKYDTSEDYSSSYSKSMCLLTDQSDTAYMFAFLTMRPVVFFFDDEKQIKSDDWHNLNYFINREKIGIIINQVNLVPESINKLKYDLKKYKVSISKLKKEIKYLGQSKKRFNDEIKSLVFNNQKSN